MAARTRRQEESFRCTAQVSVAPARLPHRGACARRHCTLGAATAAAGTIGSLDIVARPDGGTLPVYGKDGRKWVVGAPGQEYGIRVCNTTGERVLAVMSVDGVNIVSGETASPSQSGYVLERVRVRRHQRLAEEPIVHRGVLLHRAARRVRRAHGASGQRRRHRRRVLPRAAAAHQLQESSPEDRRQPPPPNPRNGRTPRQRHPAARPRAAPATTRCRARRSRPRGRRRPPHRPRWRKIGTGHGRYEQSYVQTTSFVRESATPEPDARRSTTTAARISSQWASCRRPRSHGTSIRFPPGHRGSCRIRRRAEAHARRLDCPQLRSFALQARAARILAGDARARHRRRKRATRT